VNSKPAGSDRNRTLCDYDGTPKTGSGGLLDLRAHVSTQLWAAVSASYEAGNYRHAIFDAMNVVTAILREKTGLDGDGVPLVGQALGGDTPRIRLNSLQTDSEQNVQRGVEQILRGMYTAIRNPRGHGLQDDSRWTPPPTRNPSSAARDFRRSLRDGNGVSRHSHPIVPADTQRRRFHAACMDDQAIRRAALVTLRRAICERFPLGPEREAVATRQARSEARSDLGGATPAQQGAVVAGRGKFSAGSRSADRPSPHQA
jgi:uncharacterized protein (TIGR02391 family)